MQQVRYFHFVCFASGEFREFCESCTMSNVKLHLIVTDSFRANDQVE